MSGDSWHRQLRARGYRLTPQRQLVLEAVDRLGHGTPDEIAAEVRRTANGVNLSTVYRTLELLEELGLVTHAHIGHGPLTYHSRGSDEHVHIVCRVCDQVSEVSPDLVSSLVRRLSEEQGFLVDVSHVVLTGLCAECAAAHTGELGS